MEKEKAIVYGKGGFYKENKEVIERQFDVIALVDRKEKEGTVSLSEAVKMPYNKVIIAIYDVGMCFEVIKVLMETYQIPAENIVLGRSQIDDVWESVCVDSEGNIKVSLNGISVSARNVDEYNNIYDIFKLNCYGYDIGNETAEVVLDIGMNIGGAVLFFLLKNNVKKVYAYEPFKDTYRQAMKNINENSHLGAERKMCFHYGVSNANGSREVLYNPNMSCGQSTDAQTNLHARKNYEGWQLISKDDDKVEKIWIKDIKEILMDIYKNHILEHIVLKIDCEGEEYKILERIDECNLFARIKVIMLEWHYMGSERIINILKKNGYVYWNFNQENNTGLIYAYRK
jgi:methyltransferase, FkbM family